MRVRHSMKQFVPWPVRHASRRIKREIGWIINAKRPARDVFNQVYAERRWADDGDDFHSGPGSTGRAAILYAECIHSFIIENRIRSVTDLGCGDFRVASQFVDESIDYVGVDIVKALVDRNRIQFGASNIRFKCLDIVTDELPDGELCLMREVLQHLSNSQIQQILNKLDKFRFVIYSDYQPSRSSAFAPNKDISHGQDTRIWRDSAVFLEEAPFHRKVELLLEVPSAQPLRSPGECIRTYLMVNDPGCADIGSAYSEADHAVAETASGRDHGR